MKAGLGRDLNRCLDDLVRRVCAGSAMGVGDERIGLKAAYF